MAWWDNNAPLGRPPVPLVVYIAAGVVMERSLSSNFIQSSWPWRRRAEKFKVSGCRVWSILSTCIASTGLDGCDDKIADMHAMA